MEHGLNKKKQKNEYNMYGYCICPAGIRDSVLSFEIPHLNYCKYIIILEIARPFIEEHSTF